MVPSEHIDQQKALDHCNEVMKKSKSFIDCQSDSEPLIQKCAEGVKVRVWESIRYLNKQKLELTLSMENLNYLVWDDNIDSNIAKLNII